MTKHKKTATTGAPDESGIGNTHRIYECILPNQCFAGVPSRRAVRHVTISPSSHEFELHGHITRKKTLGPKNMSG